jgi:outer membrane protein
MQEKIQEYNIKRYKVQYLPSLIAYGSLSASAQRSKFNIFNQEYKWFPTGVIGATLSLKLFDGFQREYKIRHEKLSLKKIKNEIDYFEDAIELQVSSARSALANSISALKLQEQNLELANSVSKTSKIKYDQGVGSNLEVLNAETSLKEAQSNYYNALFDAIIAKIDLEKALGNFNY